MSRKAPPCRQRAWVAAAALAMTGRTAAGAVIVENADPPGVGLSDATPAAPVGGNTETTRGAQALRAITHAAERWSRELGGAVPVRVSASFAPLPCDAAGGVVGSAIPRTFARDAAGLTPGVWYPIALANHLTGEDLVPGEPDIDAQFNGLAGSAGCLEGSGFYLGLDGSPGNRIDLVTIALHEFAHGLGVTTLVDLTTGALHQGAPDVYSLLVFDERTARPWSELTDLERAVSATRFQELTFAGPRVTAAAESVLTRGVPTLTLGTPVDRVPHIALASFGPSLTVAGVTGAVSRLEDAVGSPADGCEPATAIPGRVALIEAGGCDDATKVLTAQAAGGVAALVVDDRTVAPPLPLAGPNDGRVTIPSARITQEDAAALRAALGSEVLASLKLDPDRAQGTSPAGRVYLRTNNPAQVGRSVTHWDPSVAPDLLMEADPRPGHDLDLTVALLRDLGWEGPQPDGGVPDGGLPEGGDEAGTDGSPDATAGSGGRPGAADAMSGEASAGGDGTGGTGADGGRSAGGRAARGDGGGGPRDAGDGAGGGAGAGAEDGCGCRVTRRGPDGRAALLAVGLVAAALGRRTRRCTPSPPARRRG